MLRAFQDGIAGKGHLRRTLTSACDHQSPIINHQPSTANKKEDFIMAAADSVKLDVRVYPIAEPKSKVLAFASANIAEVFAVNNIRVVDSDKGLFVAMPQVKDSKDKYRDICFPVTAEFRTRLNEAVLGAYAAEREKTAPARESTVDKLHEARRETTENPAPTQEKTVKSPEPEL
jgi:stage V sporulation protein G